MILLLRSVLGVLLALGVGSVARASDPVAPEARTSPEPRLVVTSPTDASRQLLDVPTLVGATPSAAVVVHPDDVRQPWWGTGATLTDSSVTLLRDRPDLLKTLFRGPAAGGARLNLLRLPLSATDFSPWPWTWEPRGSTARPPAEARDAASLVRSIRKIRPGLRVIGTPWSAPASMKTSGTVRGGGLADAALPAYGQLLVDQRRWLRAHGVPLWAMTLGNEPGYSTDYPSMTMTDQQMVALADQVGPAIGSTRLWALDHNWSDRGRVDALLGATSAFDGAAFHCYGGQPSQMAGLAVPRLVTECTGTTDGAPGTFAWDAKNLVADAVAAGSSGLMMWNLALDPTHGPVDPGSQWGCRQCRGLLTVSPAGPEIREPEFFTLAHLGRAAAPGGRVVGVDAPSWLSVAAFRNPDGSVGVFGQNRSGAPQTVSFAVGSSTRTYPIGVGEMFSYRLPAS
ncbi:hypothetical protein [Nocardioides aquiterrae]|uniref:Glucosylceramidase n=1 Tax=Nocardioides aquiterrae TaxID=203799 RepID=A0ABN1UF66_9ACTN